MPEAIIRELESISYPLVKKFYKTHGQNIKTNRLDQVFAAFTNQTMMGCLRIAPVDEERLLRSVFIAPSHRGKHLATDLVQYALLHAKQDTIWTFPYLNLVALYAKVGFNEVKEEDMPDHLRSVFQAYKSQGRKISVMRWQR